MAESQAIVTACLLSLSTFVASQQPVPTGQGQEAPTAVVARAMQQSRTGAWQESITTANSLLQREGLPATRRAEALSLIAACHTRLGQREQADAAIAAFDKIASQVPANNWSVRSMARLRSNQHKQPSDPTQVLAAADLPTRIWTVRQDNQVGQHASAASAAESILHQGIGSNEQRCDLWLHLAFARHRLGRVDASQAFDQFGTAAKQLRQDHHLIWETQLVRQSLGLPPLPGFTNNAKTFSPPSSDDYWHVVEPSSVGLGTKTLATLRRLAEQSGTDGLLVTRSGKIAFEYYSPLYREPMRTMSSCKSITGLLAGMLIARGKLGLDDPVGKYLPGWRDGMRGKVTVRHLLTMTAGLPRRSDVAHQPDESWNDYAMRQRITRDPGSAWEYSNEGVQLLSPILEQAAGMPLSEFAEQELFARIGADNTHMRRLKGATNTFADTETTLREFARFGELVRNRGVWPGGGEVIPESWLDAMTTPCREASNYGYLWWIEPDGRGYSMRGYLTTNVWVFPSLDIVVARVQQRAYLHASRPFDAERMFEALSRD